MTKRKLKPQELLLELTALRVERDRVEQRIRDAVCMARQANLEGEPLCSWSSIAQALAVTRQGAAQRYADQAVRRAVAAPRRQPGAKRKGGRP